MWQFMIGGGGSTKHETKALTYDRLSQRKVSAIIIIIIIIIIVILISGFR